MIRRCLAVAALLGIPCLLGYLHHFERVRLVPPAPRDRAWALCGTARLRLQGGAGPHRPERREGREPPGHLPDGALRQRRRRLRHPTSSPTEASLRRTFQEARAQGLRMMFFPTINLRKRGRPTRSGGGGNIHPRDWDLWWRNYTAFNVHLARIAQEERGGVVQASAPRWSPRTASPTGGGRWSRRSARSSTGRSPTA